MTTKPLGIQHSHSTLAALEDLSAVGLDAKMEIEIALHAWNPAGATRKRL